VIERGERPDLGIIFQPRVLGPLAALALLALAPVAYKHFHRSKARQGSRE
jgi:hypothetical protein